MWAGGVAPTAGDPVPAIARRGCNLAEIHGPASAIPGLLCSALAESTDRGEDFMRPRIYAFEQAVNSSVCGKRRTCAYEKAENLSGCENLRKLRIGIGRYEIGI